MVRITKHKNSHYELHLGTYFRGFISTLSGFLMLICIISACIILAKHTISNPAGKMLTVFVLIALAGIFLNIFLGYEGVEFDLEKKTFRKYVKRVGIKFGDWKNMQPYTMLCLSAQYNPVSRNPMTAAGNSTVRSLEINLASLEQKSILLAECKNYKEAQQTLNQLNTFLQLEIKDFVKQDYQKASPRR